MIIVSILLDIILNNILKRSSILLPLFTLMSIIFIKKDNKNRYLLTVTIIGFIYDLFYTNFYILNPILFLLLGLLTYYFYKRFKHTILTDVLYSTVLIILYQFLLFIIFNITKYKQININEFIFIIYHYFILNIIYVFIISLFHKRTRK